ncbi:MAG: aspartate carbamoyltransferase [Oscillospiraceae bacterium]|nr:aspartate carbamoyltransferase [Oscillospiraceae bacterium]
MSFNTLSRFTNLIDLNALPVEWWKDVIDLGVKIADNPEQYARACEGRIMAALFYEPSTRTQLSFQAAMKRLGGAVIGFDNPETSSVAKGEVLKDTAKVVSGYSDIMVMRHNMDGSAKAAALSADCPIINAGDGGHLHPTQTLTDLLTLRKEKGRIKNLVIGICGDLKYGRTVHSLCKALACFEGTRFVFISTPELSIPAYIKSIINEKGCPYKEADSIEAVIGELDMLYMTRIQKERFPSAKEYESQIDVFILDAEKMKKAKSDLCVLHPLPRVDEITYEVDNDPRAKYFKQATYGMYARMALIIRILENRHPAVLLAGKTYDGVNCPNENCITQKECYLPKSFVDRGGFLECEYCERTAAKPG